MAVVIRDYFCDCLSYQTARSADRRLTTTGKAFALRAAKSLKNLANQQSLILEVKTVAQLLGQQPEINESTGKEEFLIKGEADLTGYNIVIVDEFSMVNRDNFKEIVDAARSSLLTKVVFVGDAAQLPPVKEFEPIVATSELINQDATLTEVVRYDGQIARVAILFG